MGRDEVLTGPELAGRLEWLLQNSGLHHLREGACFRLVLCSGGRKWETLCRCEPGLLLVWGRYPFEVARPAQAMACCQQVNAQVVQGSLLLEQGRLVFRTGADLFDSYSADEAMARALEYNAGVMLHFWSEAAACAAPGEEAPGQRPASE